jgi:hypothetical protein
MPENETAAPAKLPYPSSTGEVKLGATDFKELAEKANTFLKEHTLIYKARAASYNAESGELGFQESNGKTVTLPSAATANQIIGVFSNVAETKITTAGGAKIYGGGWIGETTIILSTYESVILQSNGTNWLVVSLPAVAVCLTAAVTVSTTTGVAYKPTGAEMEGGSVVKHGSWTAGTNGFVVPQPGVYSVTTGAEASGALKGLVCGTTVGGTLTLPSMVSASGTEMQAVVATNIAIATAGNEIGVEVQQSSGSGQSVRADLQIVRLGS